MRIAALAALPVLSVVALARPALSQAPARTWITDVYIVSPERLDHIEKGSVLIENGHIVRVERGRSMAAPAGAAVVSGGGRYLIPGLIDSHVHLEFVPGVRAEVNFGPAERKPAMIAKYFAQLPRSYLYFGYTTLVDPAVVDRQLLDSFREAPVHPDLYDCGPSLPLANGYPMALEPAGMGFTLYPNFLYDANRPSAIPPGLALQDHTPAAAVATVKRSGGICVKTYFDRGYGNSANLPVITPEELAEVRKAATRAGLVLMMHANSFEAQTFAVQGHVNIIAHGMWNWGALNAEPRLPSEIAGLLDRIAEERIGYQPTIQVIDGFRAYFDSTYLRLKAIPRVVPSDMVAWFDSPEGKWFKAELAPGKKTDAEMRRAYDQGQLRRVRQVVGYLARKNANLLFGTDTPAAPSYGNLPGLNGFLEMEQLRKAGMSLPQIFQAATINNARAFRLDAKLGTIEPGKIANLVLLKTSPLERIDAYDSIVTVWMHGRSIARGTLAANANP
jgi:imidazolonepropionase-like amidohydrolase